MALKVSDGRHVASLPTQRSTPRAAPVLAEHRRAYDARRREVLEPQTRAELDQYRALVHGDPCSYCMGRCGQMAADHIVPLLSGGENAWSNITAAGRPCNASKKNQPLLLWMLSRPVLTGD